MARSSMSLWGFVVVLLTSNPFGTVGATILETTSQGGIPNELGRCQGDCDSDTDCMEGLYCFQRNGADPVPGCFGGQGDLSRTDYCVPIQVTFDVQGDLISFGGQPPSTAFPLQRCEGDCDDDEECDEGLYCFRRNPFELVPSCSGGDLDGSNTDYCVPIPLPPPQPTGSSQTLDPPSSGTYDSLPLVFYGSDPPTSKLPLRRCEGDCDDDTDCYGNLVCFQRDSETVAVPGCFGRDSSRTDYCVPPELIGQTSPVRLMYTPGKLSVRKLGLLLSEGLDARLIATNGKNVVYENGTSSEDGFHFRPDGAATFPDTRPHNPGGWIYVSNSEMLTKGKGGVGAITFNCKGGVIEYRMLLTGSSVNCGGGRTPWNTWASCEESRDGQVYQVDPTGERAPQVMTIGKWGGRWEAFAYDIRTKSKPHYYITEDDLDGALCRFTPHNPDWNDPWNMLHGDGQIDFLFLEVDDTGNAGTFTWTQGREEAQANAEAYYPESEGIDVYGSQLYFVCKGIKMLYILNLDIGTWHRTSTVSGLFDGQPDQMERIIGDPRDLVYFTEDGGADAGIHARDKDARFYTIMESPEIPGETTGLSISPDGMFMYVAYQEVGKLFCLFRRDGKPFWAKHLDIKFHG